MAFNRHQLSWQQVFAGSVSRVTILLLAPIILLVPLIIFYGCGSSSKPTSPLQGNPGGGGNYGGDTVSAEVRMAALDSVQVKFEELSSFSRDSIAKGLLAYLRTRPEFEDAGINDGTTVWGRFTDGRLLIIPNNREPGNPSDSDIVDTLPQLAAPSPGDVQPYRAGSSRDLTRIAAAGQELDLPSSSEVFLMTSMSYPCFGNAIPTLRNLLQRQKYIVSDATTATVATLKLVKDAGVFYFDGHGGEGTLRDSTKLYGLWTRDSCRTGLETFYNDELNAGQLCYMEELYATQHAQSCAVVKHYGITPQFVHDFMTFSQNSMVYIDACSSDNDEFRDAFKHAGASYYFGWTGSIHDDFAGSLVYRIFDCLLGTNAEPPQVNPPQRPFDVYSIMKYLEDNGKVVDRSGASLIGTPLRDHFGLLAPSIEFVSVNEQGDRSYLTIAGLIGKDRGPTERRVTINGQPLNVTFWAQDTINCDLDVTGSKASGTIQVRVTPQQDLTPPDGDQRSNEVNLSEWSGEMHYTKSGPDSLLADIKMGIHFRGDAHSFRETPYQTPYVIEYLFEDGLQDSSGRATFSGAHTFTSSPGCTFSLVLNDSFSIGDPWNPVELGAYSYNGAIDMIHKQLQLNLMFSAGDSVGHLVYSGAACAIPPQPFEAIIGQENCLFDEVNANVPDLLIPMDSLGNVANGERECSTNSLYYLYQFDNLQAVSKIEWDSLKVKFPPLARAGH